MPFNAEDIASRFGTPKKKGKSYSIPGVCHGSENLSVNIWDGQDGGIGAACHSSGCSYATIMRALDIFTEHQSSRNTCIAVYQNIDGTPREVHRLDFMPGECNWDDCKEKGAQHKHIWGSGSPAGCYLLIWNDQPDVPVIITEGEKAAASLAQRGFTSASYRNGSKSVTLAIYSPISGRDVIIWPDADNPGAYAAVKCGEMCERADAKSVRYVLPPIDATQGWDAADTSSYVEIVPFLNNATENANALITRYPDAFKANTPDEGESEQIDPLSSDIQRVSLDTKDARLAFEIAAAQQELHFRYNTRANRVEFYETPGHQVVSGFHFIDYTPDGWAAVSANDAHGIARFMRMNYQIIRRVNKDGDTEYKPLDIPKVTLSDYIGELAQLRYEDPFMNWLVSLPDWDGTERIASYLTEVLKSPSSPAIREASAKIFLGAIKRTHKPGSEHRWMCVLVGGQDVGKSLSVRTMFPEPWQREWFTDAPALGISTKEMIEQVGGAVIVEYSELAGMRRADIEKVKAQLSRRSDTARLAYDRSNTFKQRAYISIGTANDDGQGVLPDSPSGNTRFVPVRVEPDAEELLAWMGEHREQYWAEALAAYRKDENVATWLSRETSDERAEMAEQYTAEDSISNAIANNFDTGLVKPMLSDNEGDWYDAASIAVATGLTLAKVAKSRGAFGAESRDIERELAAARTDRALQSSVGKALTKLAWRKQQLREGGARPRVYLRPDNTARQETIPW